MLGSVEKECGGGKDVGGHVMVPVGLESVGLESVGLVSVGVVAGPAVGTYRKPVDKPVAGPVQRLVGNLKGVCGWPVGGKGTAGKEWGL